jgi:AcrR family transcriptional regulator
VTKGSFYWHFRDRPELLAAVAQRWQDKQLRILQTLIDDEHPGKKDRLKRLITFTYRKDSRHDIGMRAWALTDKIAAKVVAKVDRSRMRYVESVFRDMGFDVLLPGWRVHGLDPG